MNLLSRLDSRELGNYYCKMSSLKGGFRDQNPPGNLHKEGRI